MSTLNVTNIKAADGTSALTIANSTGVVTQTVPPTITTPIIFQGHNQSTTYAAGTSGVWVASTEVIDTANAYNNSTGVFTAPRAGYYHCSWHALFRAGGSSSSLRVNFRKNGTNYGTSGTPGQSSLLYVDAEPGDEENVSMSAIIECAASDTIDVHQVVSVGNIYGSTNSHNGLSIFFIG